MRKGYRIILFLTVTILAMPFINYASAVGGEFGANDLARYMDAFPIKSEFDVDRVKTQGYKIESVDQLNDVKTYSIAYGDDKMTVKVNGLTNKIIKLYIDPRFSASAKDINFCYNSWLPTIASRYGNPTKEDCAVLYSTRYGNGNYKYAEFRENGKYKYYFGGLSVSPGRVHLVLEITAL